MAPSKTWTRPSARRDRKVVVTRENNNPLCAYSLRVLLGDNEPNRGRTTPGGAHAGAPQLPRRPLPGRRFDRRDAARSGRATGDGDTTALSERQRARLPVSDRGKCLARSLAP